MRPHAITIDPAENLTRQSFREECDINNIVETYRQTGMINHVPRGEPQYGEAPTQTMHEAACIGAEVASKFEEGFELTPEPEPDDPEIVEPEASEEAVEAQKGPQESPEKGA